jgi:hypothetical protein
MKLGFALGPCVRDILLLNVKDEDVGFIIVDDGFEWNSQPDGVDLILSNNLMLKQFSKDVVYDMIDILHFSGKLVKTTNNDMSSFWSEFYTRNKNQSGIWCDVIVSPELSTPAVKTAWEHYQIVSGLCK